MPGLNKITLGAMAAIAAAMVWLGTPAIGDDGKHDKAFHEKDVLRRGDFASDMFLAGRTVDLRGSVAADLFAAGGTVYIDAAIDDDLIATGGEININGAAADVFAAGGQIHSNAAIRDNLILAGGSVTLAGDVGGQVIAAGGRIRFDPSLQVAGGVRAAGGDVSLAGTIGGDADISAQVLRIAPETRIGGKLIFRGPQEPSVPASAVVAGGIDYRPMIAAPGRAEIRQAARTAVTVISVIWVGGLFLLGAALYLLFPRLFAGLAGTLRSHPWSSLGLGFAFLAVVPAAIFVLFITVIGTVPALVLMPLYGLALLLGYLSALLAAAHGMTARWLGGADKQGRAVLVYLALLIAVSMITAIPVIGWLAGLLLTLAGLGGLMQRAAAARSLQ